MDMSNVVRFQNISHNITHVRGTGCNNSGRMLLGGGLQRASIIIFCNRHVNFHGNNTLCTLRISERIWFIVIYGTFVYYCKTTVL